MNTDKPVSLSKPQHSFSPDITDRLALLNSLGASLKNHQKALVTAAGEDIGTPCRIAALEVQLAVEHLESMDKDVMYVLNKIPYGTVGAIFPYDAVSIFLGRVGGAAVLGGNTFRFSCSSQTPQSAHLLAELLRPFPSFQPIIGLDNKQFGAACVADPEVQAFFISGGGEVGRLYESKADSFAKLFFAGPSGMPAAILASDAPVEAAANFLVRRAFINAGQYCTTIKKAYIAAPIYDAVKNTLLDLLPTLKIGDPRDPEVWIGPVRVNRTRLLLQEALRRLDGPRFLQPIDLAGEFIKPIICEVMDVPDLEMFGPFLALIKVADAADAVNRAVRTRYPFAVSLFGSAPAATVDLLKRTFGMVYLNPDFTFTPLRLPFGGRKDSGWILENHGGKTSRRDGAFIYSAELVHDP